MVLGCWGMLSLDDLHPGSMRDIGLSRFTECGKSGHEAVVPSRTQRWLDSNSGSLVQEQ